LAAKCGWTKDYIADNLTVQQIKKYCEIIQNQNLNDKYLDAILSMQSVAVAFGTIKYKDFKKFLDTMIGEKEDVDKALEDLKRNGFPIEEK